MVDLTRHAEDAELRAEFGAATFERGADYMRRGMVNEVRHEVDDDGDLDIRGTVAGSRGWPYSVAVSVGFDGNGLLVASRCTCPVREDCKHVVALLLTVRAEQKRDGPADPARRWERQLSSLLDELDLADAEPAQANPLGLQVELQRRASSGRWAKSGRGTAQRGLLRLRPVQRGARNNWVRSGVSWQDIPNIGARRGFQMEQVAVLGELLTAYRTATRQTFLGAETHLQLALFGPGLWELLRRTERAGIALVPGAGLSEVRLAPDPVTLRLDVNAAPDHDAQLRPGVALDGEWYGAADLDVLGDSGHGVALWSAPDLDRDGRERDAWALTLAPLSRPAGPEVRRLLRQGESVVVPADGRADLVEEYLPRLHRHVPVVSSDGSVEVPEQAEPRLALTVTWVSVEEVSVEWSWRYRVGAGDRVYRLDETRGLRGVRRPDEERAVLDKLDLDDAQAYQLCRAHDRDRGLEAARTFRHSAAIGFAEEVLPGLRGQVEVEEIGKQPDYREAAGAPVVRFARSERRDEHPDQHRDPRTDWLDLQVEISVDGHSIGLAQLLEALTKGRDRVILHDAVHVRVDRPEFAHLAELVEAAGELRDQPRDGVRVGHHDLGLWDELAEVGVVDAQADRWVRAAKALRGMDTLPEVEPTGVDAKLRSYQRDGFRWLAFLWQAGLGGILADDMGLGKTLQTLALVAHARAQGAAPFLVVAPTSVVSTWAHEAAAFTPGLTVRTVTESHARRGESVTELADGADLVVTSYTLLRMEAEAYQRLSWGGLVLDEAQMVKNHRGKTYQTVRRLDVPFRLALTGTPMENRLLELWSLLSIVAPGLYPWPQRFVELVANPVERLGDTAVLDRFRRRIRPFLLRRTKELVAADLPPKQEQVLEVALTPRHRRIYETHLQRERQTVLGLVDDFEKHRIAIFRSLTRLRQLSLDAALVDEEYDGVGSAKVDVLVDHLLEIVAEGHRALVFSQFTSFLRRVRARLDREGIASDYLDGSTRNRGEVVGGFKAGDAPVFLISLKAGGVGLTLTEADYCFVLDPWWNPAVEAQAVDRAHRIGQRRTVLVYRLVATDTIEEKVMELKARKAALFSQVVDEDALMAAPLGADDVRALFAE